MLSVTEIEKSFGGVRALSGASLDCAAGEIVGLIGPNGAGKSTFVNVVTGFLRPDAGHVSLGGRDIAGIGPQQVSHAGIARTFQNLRVFRDLSVRQNIEVAHLRCRQLRPDRAARVNVAALLTEFGLEDLAEQPAGSLPYGTQRWMEIARALATAPEILMLDEPAAGLNDDESARLGRAIAGIRDRTGCGILVIDHDLRFINSICGRLFVMDQGRLIASGAPAEVWADPRVIEVYVGPGSPDQHHAPH
ncbi:ABC transporter ATP-binding protein [Gemmobacter fulvus]|uniref:ABC transporter ATP-binding protein n=1 Tax=Gemmobacter fulvus TaxID=2840474 RepID=UPI002796D63B|nr:ABC transporter ATP-binding protein [Gemmobacter fulvus]MDQ1848310.1 ABC transporter ATP-binding protein [Gemmobacter fulvus]